MDFYLRIHERGNEKLAAICDIEIHGQTIHHNGVSLTIKKEFYGNEIFTIEEVLHEIIGCTSINAFGKKICDLLVETKLVHPATIVWFDHNSKKVGHVIIIK